jgi:GT2 family glycosyltransferase
MLPNLIVPVLTRYDLLQRMLDSIDIPVKHLLIVDNGAGDNPDDLPVNTLQLSDVITEVTYLPMPANLGVAGSWNLGIQSFPFDDRWFIVSDDVVFHPGAMQSWLDQSHTGQVTISAEWPHWQFFTVGEDVVNTVGLFDSNFFPANFEDDDYRWRCEHFGVPIVEIDAPHDHVKQGTVFHSKVAGENSRTYPRNEERFRLKQERQDYGAGDWSLQIRRDNHWRVQ